MQTSPPPPLPDVLAIAPIARLSGTLQLPGSKSLSNRALLLSALAQGETVLSNVLDSEDTQVMVRALTRLGVGLQGRLGQGDLRVRGCAGPFPASRAALQLGNAGTAMRPLAAALTLGQGEYILRGIPRMHERPIGDLVQALGQLGGQLEYLERPGFPPLRIVAGGLAGGTAALSGSTSSQFLSALLMVGGLARSPVQLRITDTLVSRPYVELTIRLLERFGVRVENPQPLHFVVQPAPQGRLQSPGRLWVEGDASSASYFLAAAALSGGEITVQGCGRDSWQGDIHFASVLERMGARVTWGDTWVRVGAPPRPSGHPQQPARPLAGLDVDLNTMPDAAMTLAVCGLFTQGPLTIRGVANWRVKETDRMAALATELAKLGATTTSGEDWLRIVPPSRIQPAQIDTYNDHRIAMAFALAACGGSTIHIHNPACVRKTFPHYFATLESLRS